MPEDVSAQASQLHRAVKALLQHYQSRDRNEMCCYGISVSQCSALEALGTHGVLSMQGLAEQMHLAVSTVTRVIDQLVEKRLTERHHTARDRRVCCVSLTAAGAQLLQTIQADLVTREQRILERIPVDSRAHVIGAIEALAEAMEELRQTWQQDAVAQGKGE